MGDRSSTPSVAKPLTDFVPGSLDQSSLPMLEPPSYATPNATKSLNRALKEVLDIQNKTPLHELGWYIDQELINNIYQWIVELHSFDPKLPLTKDMKAAGLTSVVLEIRFGKDYPFSPPFVRVIRPRFLPFMNGGGGHVTAGGAMCMELLTNSGWSAVSSIESVLLQVRMAIMNTDPKPARLESQGKAQQRDYGTGEAIDAYIRACRTHGWQVPPDFNDFAVTGSSGY
jgi:ubiquitin-conjugating enzyme E2 Q